MDNTYDLLLTGGMVVTGTGLRRADVGVRGELVAAVEPGLSREAAKDVVDVAGKYVFPGIIDAHVHPVYLDTVEDCSQVAAYGGTTTLLHFAYARTGDRQLAKAAALMMFRSAEQYLNLAVNINMRKSLTRSSVWAGRIVPQTEVPIYNTWLYIEHNWEVPRHSFMCAAFEQIWDYLSEDDPELIAFLIRSASRPGFLAFDMPRETGNNKPNPSARKPAIRAASKSLP